MSVREPGGLKPDWVWVGFWFRDLKVVARSLTLLPPPAHSEECGYQPPILVLIIIIRSGFVVVFLVERKV